MRATLAALLIAAAAGPAAATPPVPTAQQLMNWAEASFPLVFPGPETDRTLGTIVYRHYAATGNYVGVAGSSVYVMGPIAGSATVPRYLGELAAFACPVAPAECGVKTVHRVAIGGVDREFIVYQPWRAQAAQRVTAQVPAVFVLHGTSGDGERFYNISGWREKADAEGFVAVFPSALHHCFREDENGDGTIAQNERQIVTKWAQGWLGGAVQPLCGAAEVAQLPAAVRTLVDHPLADDIAFVTTMLDTLAATYTTDPRRTYAAGFSNGAQMVSRLAAELSDRFAAVAPAAGNLTVTTLPARPMSVLLTVGSLDSLVVPALGYASAIPLDASLAGNPLWLAVMVTPWSNALGLAANPVWSAPRAYGTQLSRLSYGAAAQGATHRFEALVIDGADHLYPNGVNHPVRLAELVWEFFRNESLP